MSTPSVVRVIGTADQLAAVNTMTGVVSDDHGHRLLEDGRWSIILYVTAPEAIDQLRALGLDVTVRLTPEQLLAENAQIAAEEGDQSASATGNVLAAFAPPFSDAVPDDFALTVQPSVGSPTVFGKADLTDAGDGLLTATITNPGPGILYSARAQSASAGIDVAVFEDFELQRLIAALVTPSITPRIPALQDPFVFATDEEDPDVDSQPAEPDEVDPAKMAQFRNEAGRSPSLPNA